MTDRKKDFLDYELDTINRHMLVVKRLMQSGEFKQAMKRIDKILRLNPLRSDALINKGYLQIQFENYEEAIGTTTEALQCDDLPDSGKRSSWHNIGYCHFMLKEFGKAKEAFIEALMYDDTNPETLHQYGRVLFALQDYYESYEVLKSALEKKPRNMVYMVNFMRLHDRGVGSKEEFEKIRQRLLDNDYDP
ncbi:MAG: hypothetical protein ACXAD7_21550 [Candidatus Kariarchaeaceae archaeon]|jgi:tetratricopeptide (TPR) repeat protein